MKLFTQALLDDLAAKAMESPRGRAHHNIHATAADPLQRFFVVANRQSYIRPHRHRTKFELAMVLRGRFDVVTFDDEGRVTGRWTIGDGSSTVGYESPSMTWHTLVARTDGSAFLEIKEGPYDPVVAAEFAAWAPAEGDPEAEACLYWLRAAQPGDRFAG